MTSPAPSAVWTRPVLRRSTVVVLAMLTAAGPVGTDLYLPGLPGVASDLDTSAAAAQLTITAFLLGLALGQLIAGPIGDQLGRRMPILVGVSAYGLVSVGCAVAPDIRVLIVLRFVQGALGAVGLVLARAWVRDVSEGVEAARTYSLLAVIAGVVPIAAPVVGAQLLRLGSWRITFWSLAGFAVVSVALVLAFLPESLPKERRGLTHEDGRAGVFRDLYRDPAFVAAALATTFMSCALFAYIAGSPFVLQEVYDLSSQQFSFAFAANALGVVSMSIVSRRLASRVGPGRLATTGLALATCGAVLLLVSAIADLPLGFVLVGLFVMIAQVGLVLPNATTLGLQGHAAHAGTAAGVLGVCQFGLAVVIAPLTGIGGPTSAIPLAIVCVVPLAIGAVVVPTLLRRARPAPAAPPAVPR